ncbi:flagellar biosynthetic protein FliR [Pseudoduganella flava]|uniref:Flagellar biosynthetic protein FliR n=1 Tax=Pseudoduganella flava TaxID=871742 RepID=A0A562PTG0_9BURK|nr:flagellar biosynthetic protein FliR [Pseudoduganella flava]QGZ39250.1 flagellar biosynthetic protein FliR [Pseudoduganella flava]TWI47450.1 flagellar biosynthetic protein FliR [Pseudoduganella flava]
MLYLTAAEINTWIAGFIWPLTRVLGLIAASPVFGNARIPRTARLGFGVVVAIAIAPLVPAVPATDPASWEGILILAKELITGVAMGFAMRLVFAAVEMAGEISSLTMGLGFASFFDPMSQGRSSAISQFLAWIATLTFLVANVHLLLLEALAESFVTLPISSRLFHGGGFWDLALWGAKIFSAGLQLSLPVVAALLIANVALGILTRAAPQLNLFGIGFPITLGAGFLVLMISLPYLAAPIVNLLGQGAEKAQLVPRALQGQGNVPPRPQPPAAR